MLKAPAEAAAAASADAADAPRALLPDERRNLLLLAAAWCALRCAR
jgi:hypothetical protein